MTQSEAVDARTAGAAAAAGVAAYLLGYLATYVLHRGTVDERLRRVNAVLELFGNEAIPSARAVGWLFYNAHFVDLVFPGVVGERTLNVVLEGEGAALTGLFVVPPLLLVVAGLAVAARADASAAADGATAGALVVAGYLPTAIAGVLAFTHAVGDGTVAPDVVTAVLLAGVVYPVVFGGLGGVAWSLVAGRS